MIGQTLRHYHISSLLGVGGMGEVYRARDTKLGREVAIKVLPASIDQDPDRVARFHREARLLASLNHPHIAAVYGFEEHGGKHFLVLELIEGETLQDRLQGGPLPLGTALEVAQQIAEALEAAHGKGIIHRDLKPGNVKFSASGKEAFGVNYTLSGIAFLNDLFPRRFSCNGGTITEIAAYEEIAADKGNKAEIRSSWLTAADEESFIFDPEVFVQLIPRPITNPAANFTTRSSVRSLTGPR